MIRVAILIVFGFTAVAAITWLVLYSRSDEPVYYTARLIYREGAATPVTGPYQWSNPDTWGGEVPRAGGYVSIPRGVTVVLDISPPDLAHVHIEGELVFARKDLALSTASMIVHGRIEIGTPTQPFLQRATITLMPSKRPDEHGSMKGIIVNQGVVELHGEPREPSWTRLVETAPQGADRIVLEQPTSWRAGDRIVIAPSGVDPGEAEEATVKAVDGHSLLLDRKLQFAHSVEAIPTVSGSVIDARPEVGLLSRTIVIQGDESSREHGFGGHLMFHQGSGVHMEWVEFTRMGQAGVLARYPVHFHLAGDMTDSYVSNSSIHHNFNRCLTIHGTHNLVAERNVAYDTFGHCYFFEDAVETGNRLLANLGLLTRAPSPENVLIPSDRSPSTFWLSHPDNVLRDNVAAGSEGYGIWLDPPPHPTGLSRTDASERDVWPQHAPLGQFSDNLTHANLRIGLLIGHYFGGHDFGSYKPRASAHSDEPALASFAGFTSYKSRGVGVHLIGDNIELTGAKIDSIDPRLMAFVKLDSNETVRLTPYAYVGRFYWAPSVLRGDAGAKLRLDLANTSEIAHSFTLPAQDIDLDLPAGATAYVEVNLPLSGSLLFVCRYHETLGMTGELVAAGASPKFNHTVFEPFGDYESPVR